MITKHPKNARRPKSAPGRSQFLKQLAFAQKVGAKYGGADLREHDGPADGRVILTIDPVNVWPVDMRGG